MQYRRLGRTGQQVSAISLGTEYLINQPREHVNTVIHEAIDRGVNYFDLFFAQSDFRDSMGAAFSGRRDQVMLTAHLGTSEHDGQYERTRDLSLSERLIEDFLRRYHTDHVDVLFLHNSDGQEDHDLLFQEGSFYDAALRFQREGKTRFIGFSGHTVATARQAVESSRIDVLMFPISFAGNAVPGRRDLFSACAANDVGLVAMKPFGGGRLLQQTRVVKLEHWMTGGDPLEAEVERPITPIQCLSYVLSQPGLSTIVPGCKDLHELAVARSYWTASEEERDFSAVVADFGQYVEGECCYCNHCLPCPSGIDVGQTMRLLDVAERQMTGEARAAYAALPASAGDCLQCGNCVERCPFGVDVTARMERAAALFA